MSFNSDDFEKLGVFYLGKTFDPKLPDNSGELLLYDSKDLTTHAVVVGMTGSGKTGLCLGILEEAALDRIPAIVIDPKGDIANLLLTFPDLSPADFEPWVDPGQAIREGLDVAGFAAKEAAKWKKGLEGWGQDGERIRRMRDAVEMRVYTPGSTSGRPLTILKSFAAPPREVLEDSDAIRERITSAASGLLALLGIDADPIRSREHILISQVLNLSWSAGKDLDLGGLIAQIQKPPFARVGIMELDAFFPEKDRMQLAMTVNNLLASPSFANWMIGEALNVKNLLHNRDGKPCISILSIAHLNDAERMFFVTILLNEILAWTRTQAGTSSLRALLYMDEVFGYFPPTANPPSKQPMLTLLKQARAFGVGVILATQNPVDLDYKGLSNTGTWFLGRLQTERDKMRVIEGLEGAAVQTGSTFNRKELEQILAGLGSRKFLMNNVHDDHPVIFETRWCMSYLRGPLTRQQIQKLTASSTEIPTPDEPKTGLTPHQETTADREHVGNVPVQVEMPASERLHIKPTQMIPSEIEQRFLEPTSRIPEGKTMFYRPALFASGNLRFARAGFQLDQWETRSFLQEIQAEQEMNNIWTDDSRIDCRHFELSVEPHADAEFASPPIPFQTLKNYKVWERSLRDFLYRTQNYLVYECNELKDAFSRPGETRGEFLVRLETLISEHRDQETEKLRSKFATRFQKARNEIDKLQLMKDREAAQYKSKRLESILDVGSSIMGALLGRKSRRRVSTTARNINNTAEQRTDVLIAEEKHTNAVNAYKDLDVEFNKAMNDLHEKLQTSNVVLTETLIPPRKTDIKIERFCVCWVPYFRDEYGNMELAH